MICSLLPGLLTANSAPGEGRTHFLKSRTTPQLYYYLFIPEKINRVHRLLVSVHGISRNAEDHINQFRQLANHHGIVVLAPLFSKKHFRDYQRLGRNGKGIRADLGLISLIQEVGRLYDLDVSRVNMFGYSGGGQFVHRFAFAHPERVGELMLGAPGWYTWPDPTLSYPHGIANAKGLDGIKFDPVAIASLDFTVVVGQQDDDRDEELNQSSRIDKLQGLNRIERGRNWVTAMNAAATRQGLERRATFTILQGTGHSFNQSVTNGGLDILLFESFYPRKTILANNSQQALKQAVHAELISLEPSYQQ